MSININNYQRTSQTELARQEDSSVSNIIKNVVSCCLGLFSSTNERTIQETTSIKEFSRRVVNHTRVRTYGSVHQRPQPDEKERVIQFSLTDLLKPTNQLMSAESSEDDSPPKAQSFDDWDFNIPQNISVNEQGLTNPQLLSSNHATTPPINIDSKPNYSMFDETSLVGYTVMQPMDIQQEGKPDNSDDMVFPHSL